ncbi:gamma-glutamyltransferase [Atopomonas sediminilitoris]|uniref:gamma-glutamyltransferase n=1 Tax=Atopomonas sediminilitoris TaxID=2919919 RepID=UPI001F4F04C7|nr:gamma-glutamyltransferase [Atopomonas sediminilitoris]MCJ8170483.1 gamma-glutamyltransferase [Atopomonas sediminilitoris]
MLFGNLAWHARLVAGCVLLLSLCVQAGPQPPQAAIVSAHPLASAAGQRMLQEGGNAFDAAIAISAALAVVEPYGSGLGGGGFYLLRQPDGHGGASYPFIDARERAPLAAHANLYRRGGKVQPELSLNGPLAAAIPGIPAALAYLASQFGQLPLSTSLAPAIELAEQGFAVDEVYRQRASWRRTALQADATSARLFLRDGEVPAAGSVLHQPELANTLRLLARDGHAGFYGGDLADQLVEGVRAAGGIWSMEDLASYQVVERPALRLSLDNGETLISAPPPSAGGVAIAQSLAMLQWLPWHNTSAVDRQHAVVEVLRRAYRDRRLLGDPDHVSNPLSALLDSRYLRQQAASIEQHRATPSAELAPPLTLHEGDHTTHFSVLDLQGRAVSATLSINLPFGAAFTVPGTGVLLNDEMDDFAADSQGSNAYGLAGSQANSIAAGKRPLSSMSPSFIDSPTRFASFGTPGGSRIPSMVLLAMLARQDQQPITQWPALARYHHQFLPDHIEHEKDAFTLEQRAELQRRGHTLKAVGRRYGNLHVIAWHKADNHLSAASDPRGLGQPLVFKP